MGRETSDSPPEDDDIRIEELVFSCCICQATISDVYAITESNQRFHSGSSNEDGIVTKLWITSCSHVTCSKHLENGGIPFHPNGGQPRAPCPKCVQDKNDDTPKDLFGLQGFDKGQYDRTIPELWMHCPAIKLDDSIPGMDAVRFQYMAICHFGREIRKKWKDAVTKQLATEASCLKERKARQRLQSEQQELRQRVDLLQKAEARLKKWEDRKPVINHYMNAFTEMSKDNERMRRQLIELGYDIPIRKNLYEPAEVSKSTKDQPEGMAPTIQYQKPLAAESVAVTAQSPEAGQSSSARKRKRDEHVNSRTEHGSGNSSNLRRHSRDVMPPPLPRTKPATILPTPRPFGNDRPGTLQAESLHSSVPQDRRAWQQSLTERQHEQHDKFTGPYEYTTSHRQGQGRVDTSSGMQRQPQVSQQHIESRRCFDHSGYRPQIMQDMNGSDAVSLGQLSLRSREEDDLRPSQPQVYDRSDASRARQSFPSQTRHLRHGIFEPQPEYYGLSSPEHVDQQDDFTGRLPGSYVQSSVRAKAVQAFPQYQQATASSPFFKRSQPTFRPDNMQRFPARANQGHLLAYENGHGELSEITADLGHLDQTRGVNRATYDDPSHRPSTHQTFYQRPRDHYDMVAHGQYNTVVPLTPHKSRDLLRRPDCPPSAIYRSPANPDSRNLNKRITLPRSAGLHIPMAATQDDMLSHIRGVRGSSSHQHTRGYQQVAPPHNVAQTLFSSGPRQSVRR